MTLVDEAGNQLPDKTQPPPLPPQPDLKFHGLIRELERQYVKALTPRPLSEAIFAGFAFINLGIAFLQKYEDERDFCARRLQFVRTAEFPKIRRTLIISADRMPVMALDAEGTKARHLVPPTSPEPYEDRVMNELQSQFYATRLLPEVQALALHLENKKLLRKESHVRQQFTALFGQIDEEEELQEEDGEDAAQ